METLNDEKLIALCQQNNEDAFQVLYQRYYPVAYKLAYHICKSEADARDATQETMIAVYRNIQNLKQSQYFNLWLKRIVVGKCNRIFRKEAHINYIDEDSSIMKHRKDEKYDHDPMKTIHFQSDREVMSFFISMLPDSQAEVMILFYFEQYSIKEIAKLLRCSQGTIKSRIYAAKKKLREYIKEYEERENIVLDFQSDALFSMLASSMFLRFPKLKKASVFTSTTGISIALVGVIAAAGVGAYHEAQKMKELQKPSMYQANMKSETNKDFPTVELSDCTINNAQDAYFKAILLADDKETFSFLDEYEYEDLKKLTDALEAYGGPYYDEFSNQNFILSEK